ncbi:MAG: hypothetical protein H5T61_07040 [Thermoflexales bacterium]|nr:hypothetical protein [Thermoflexales bacterium]
MPAPTPSPIPISDPAAFCRIPGPDGRIFVISDEELQGLGIRARQETLRQVIRTHYPGWADYTQQLTFGGTTVTYDLARIASYAGWFHESMPYININPWVILTVLTLQHGPTPPPDFKAWQTAQQLVLDLNRAYHVFRDIRQFYQGTDPAMLAWRDGFANPASFAIARVLEMDPARLREWCWTYYTLTRSLGLGGPPPAPAPAALATPPASPFTVRPDPTFMCQIPGPDGHIFVISNDELIGFGVDQRLETLRAAIRMHYPGWAGYTQRVITPHYREEVDADLAQIVYGFPIEGPSGMNPWVLLTTLMLRYGEIPPPHFDAWGITEKLDLQIYLRYFDAPERWQDRFANKGSYAMARVWEEDETRLREWCHTYHTLVWEILGPRFRRGD